VGLLVVKVRRLAPAAVLLELGQTLVGFSSNNGFQFVHNCRRIYPDPFSIQSPLWSAPSHGRLPYGKMANSMEGQETVHSVCGPLTHSVKGEQAPGFWYRLVNNVSDMRLFVTSVLSEEPWKYDSKVIPMPWRQTEVDAIKAKLASGGLTLGFYNCDGNVRELIPNLNCK
jgi:hypothetical protein